jgi:hypothetical protein
MFRFTQLILKGDAALVDEYPARFPRRIWRLKMIKTRIRTLTIIAGLLCLTLPVAEGANIYQSQDQSTAQKTRLEIPQGWQVYRGQTGLVVIHPKGWKIQERPNGAFLGYRPGGSGGATAVVLVEPIQKIEGQATGVVSGIGQIFPDLFPSVKVTKTRRVSRDPEVAMADMQYTAAGQPFRGVAMCFKDKNQGVLYAIASTGSTWTDDEPVMKGILERFFYAEGQTSGKAPKGKGAVSLPKMVSWRDPAEGAFTCPVPKGWAVDGGLKRFTALDVRPELLVTSPDNTILIRIGDAFVPPMVVPSQMLQSCGLVEGSWYSPDGLNQLLIMRYLPSTSFLTDLYLPQRVGQISNVQTRDFPDISQQAQAGWAQAGIAARVDTGEMTFEAETAEGHRLGYAFAQTALIPLPGIPDAANWYVTVLNGYVSTPKAEPTAQGLLSRMVAGYRTDPNWQAQQIRTTGQVSQIMSDTNNQISDMIAQTFQDRSASQDRMFEQSSRAIRDQVLIEDPDTGERFEVAAGGNYYWRLEGEDAFVGTETATSPYLPNHWVREMHLRD